jgi:cytochrome b561
MLKNTIDSYGSVTKTLHWLIAVLIIGMLVFGFFLEDIPKPLRGEMIGLHKSIGLTILLLIILRLIWRYINPVPMLPMTVPLWEQIAARLVHLLFYLFLILMPLSGWIMSSLGGHPVLFWGLLNWTLPVTPNESLGNFFFNVHAVIAWIIIGLLVLHIGAAIKHHFIEKNHVLRRMLPGYKPPHLFSE